MSNLTLKEILLKSTEFLKAKGIGNARYETELILSHFLNKPRMDLYLEFERRIPEEQANIIRNAIVERGKRKPLQYILGNVQFLDCVIEVNEDVLIPRPETEYMVSTILSNCQLSFINCKILDLCTGSGAIAIALKKKFKDAEVFATDICEKALAVAKRNAEKNGCEIVFIQSDMFEKFVRAEPLVHPNSRGEHTGLPLPIFDIIISNPPYISEEDYKTLEPELFFEPEKALVAEKNGLFFYEKILKEAKNFMKEDGLLYLEIGSEQADDVIRLAKEYNYTEYTIHKDLSDRNRFVRIKK